MENDFWREAHRWPTDPSGYIFLARALHKIGEAMFGEKWTGSEPTTTVVPLLPDWQELASPADKRRAHLALMDQFARKLEETISTDPRRMVPSLTDAEWQAAHSAVRLEHEASLPAAQRLAAVQRKIVEQCEAGWLVSACRPVGGGAMAVVAKEVWNTERWLQRFFMCQLNPNAPFAAGVAGSNYCWIFLTRGSLDKFLLGQPFADVTTESDVHLSPYLRVMHAVARKLSITPECQPKKEEIIAVLQTTWTGSPPLSQRLLDAMATLLREPESQAGRANKKARGK